MKKIKIIQIIELFILVIIAMGLIGFLTSVSKNSELKKDKTSVRFDFDFGSAEHKELKKCKEEQVSSSGIEKIEIDLGSCDLQVIATDEDVIKIVESSSKNLDESELFTLSNENGRLKVTKGNLFKGFIFHFGMIGHKLQVFIPKKYIGNLSLSTGSGDITLDSDLELKDLIVNAGSGDLEINSSVKAQSFKSKLGSGHINAGHVECKDYALNTGSGDIEIESLKGSGRIEVSSGSIRVDELIGGEYDIESSSGDIIVNNIEGMGEIHASSGDIEAAYKGINEYAKLDASSGEINVKLDKTISFEMDARCASGEVRGNVPMDYKDKDGKEAKAKVGDEPSAKLTFTTASGDITVNQ